MTQLFSKLEPPPGGLERFRANLANEHERRKRRWAWPLVPALAAALVALVFLLLPREVPTGMVALPPRSILVGQLPSSSLDAAFHAVASAGGPSGSPPGSVPGAFGDVNADGAGGRFAERQYPGQDQLGEHPPHDPGKGSRSDDEE